MSLILDALRKSEHQRQRQAGPGLAVVPESRAGRRPAAWIIVLGALLALNILVLAALLLTDRPPAEVADVPAPPADAAPAPAQADRTVSAPVELPSRAPRSEVRPLTTEVTEPAAAPAPAPAAAARAETAGPRAPMDAPRAAAPQTAVERATDDARLPRFADLVVRGELNVPHMHIDIHVFSGNPDERFVFINMRRYNEGQATQEGPRVERITNDGVVMDHQGQRFFLPRD